MSLVSLTSRARSAAARIKLPPFAMGAAPLGNLYSAVSDEQAEGAVQAALEAGFCYFDTAPHYGFGLSESRLGACLPPVDQVDEKVIISTKVGRELVPIEERERASARHGFVDTPDLKPVFDYSFDGVMRSFESSCKRLGRSGIDLVLVHDLGELTHGKYHDFYWQQFCDGGLQALRALQAQGRIGAVGLGVNEVAVCERALAEWQPDVLLLAGRYTLLEQTPLDTLFPACRNQGVAVIAAGPFNSGILAGGLDAQPVYYNYEPAPSVIIDKARAIESVCREFSVPMQAAALQFPAAHPEVTTVLAGFASAAQVQSARRWLAINIPEAFWLALRDRGLIDARSPLPIKENTP